jgi:hypothetical protein
MLHFYHGIGSALGRFLEKVLKLEERSEVHVRLPGELHPGAKDTIKHPGGNFESIALLIPINAAMANGDTSTSQSAVDHERLAVEGMPAILDFAKLGLVGIVVGS